MKQNHNHKTITCLIGDPVEHSVSDVMFQYFAKLAGIKNYSHLKFRIDRTNHENLKTALKGISVFGIAGANITLPYKESSMKYLDIVDKTVNSVGAVNTIVNKRGKIAGYNTDGHGALKAIETKLRPIKNSDIVVIFGAGGAARAIIGVLPKISCLTLLVRPSDFSKAKKLKQDFVHRDLKMEIKLLTDKNIVSTITDANLVINATPVGMYPKNNNSLISKKHLDSVGRSAIKNIVFFDAVFNPFETKFLKLAKQYGAKTCPGLYMMIYQGIKAFKLWTGRAVSEKNTENISRLLQKTINSKYEK